MSKEIKHFYEFKPFSLDISNRLLLREGELVALKPKVFDTLLLLVENNGRVLGKDELLATLWPDTVVEESNLTQNIYVLRKALGDGLNETRYIETIPKRGYRFIAPVQERFDAEEKTESRFIAKEDVSANKPEQAREIPSNVLNSPAAFEKQSLPGKQLRYAALLLGAIVVAAIVYLWTSYKAKESTAVSSTKSIAVLPFNALNSEPKEDFMGTGMTDALITKLSNVKIFKVLPTGAVLKYSNQSSDPVTFGRQLGVDSVLDGTIQKSNDSIRVTVQLIRVADGAALWSGRFDENFTNVFAVQDSISEQVAQALTLRLGEEEKKQLRKHYTDNTAAYEAYLKGRYFWNKRTTADFNKAIEYFRQSIEIDPDYALAYAGLADCYMRLNDRGFPPLEGTVPRAKSAVLKALEIDDSLAEAHATLGFINFRFEWDFASAEKEFKRAIELNPHYSIVHQWYAFYLLTVNRQSEAFTELNRAREIEPLSLNINSGFGTYFYFTREYQRAADELYKAIEMESDFAEAHRMLGLVYEQQGRKEEAEREFKNLQNSTGNSNPGIQASLAHLQAKAGKPAEAQKVLDDLQEMSKQRYISPYDIALIYAGLDDREQAVTWLEKAYTERALRPAWLKFDPRLDNLRSLERFQNLLRRAGLT